VYISYIQQYYYDRIAIIDKTLWTKYHPSKSKNKKQSNNIFDTYCRKAFPFNTSSSLIGTVIIT
jgi:hypothetical protein